MRNEQTLFTCKEIICNAGGWVDNFAIRLGMVAQPWSEELKQAVRYLMDEYNYSLK